MGYPSLRSCVEDIQSVGMLRVIDAEIDPHLEMAAIQRRVFAAGGPAILFARPRGTRYPMLANLFGTRERVRYIFRDAWENIRRMIELKVDPKQALCHPLRYWRAPFTALSMLPMSVNHGPVMESVISLKDVPKLTCWQYDGGPFVTLPQVYTEHPDLGTESNWRKSNLGMYRVQLGGGDYTDSEIGLHYQIHRGIGVHHAAAIARGEPLRANIFVGGPPAMTLAAVMPLPEGMSELVFAGALNRRRVRMVHGATPLPFHAEADFVISGTIDPQRMLPEGPFGDHLGYYAKIHDFPVMRVERVYARQDAIWPFTVVGRPPQEDTIFGEVIHELTGPAITTVLPGIKAVHAVDAAGVHPLLLAIGTERYVPYEARRKPRELHTQAHAILGQGQLSLAKYLWITTEPNDASLEIHDVSRFLQFMLERVDWSEDLHFTTRTTIDTLDYSGTGLNEGSKVFIAAAGPRRRNLPRELPADFQIPTGLHVPKVKVVMPGVLVVEGPSHCGAIHLHPTEKLRRNFIPSRERDDFLERFCNAILLDHLINQFPLVVIVDDCDFAAQNLNNFVWVTFTRSNPAHDIHGIASFTEQKHWGCRGSLVIDARSKPWHSPELEEDESITRRIESLAVSRGPLAGLF